MEDMARSFGPANFESGPKYASYTAGATVLPMSTTKVPIIKLERLNSAMDDQICVVTENAMSNIANKLYVEPKQIGRWDGWEFSARYLTFLYQDGDVW
jgi:hypothetical protein